MMEALFELTLKLLDFLEKNPKFFKGTKSDILQRCDLIVICTLPEHDLNIGSYYIEKIINLLKGKQIFGMYNGGGYHYDSKESKKFIDELKKIKTK